MLNPARGRRKASPAGGGLPAPSTAPTEAPSQDPFPAPRTDDQKAPAREIVRKPIQTPAPPEIAPPRGARRLDHRRQRSPRRKSLCLRLRRLSPARVWSTCSRMAIIDPDQGRAAPRSPERRRRCGPADHHEGCVAEGAEEGFGRAGGHAADGPGWRRNVFLSNAKSRFALRDKSRRPGESLPGPFFFGLLRSPAAAN